MNCICGIYKITNLVNGKSYIGQSINIFSRWKQHTQSLGLIKNPDNENPLRRAFLKYGLTQQISQPGIYGNFKFEILKECSKDLLTENEYTLINELKPEYNRMLCAPSADRMWPISTSLSKSCYIQYHDFNKNEGMRLPFDHCHTEWLDDFPGYINTKKREALKQKGNKVYMIVGIKQAKKKCKDYFLWGYTQIEEIEYLEYAGTYGLAGTFFYCEEPLKLNDLEGFETFKKNTVRNFASGFQNIINDDFHLHFTNYPNYKMASEMPINYLEWLANFEQTFLKDEFYRLTKFENGLPKWSFCSILKDKKFATITTRAVYANLYKSPDHSAKIVNDFLEHHKQVKYLILDLYFFDISNFVKLLKNIKCSVIAFKELENDFKEELEILHSMNNVKVVWNHNFHSLNNLKF